MRSLVVIIVAGSALWAVGAGARAQQPTCESVRTDLIGTNLYGRHTIGQLSQETKAGDCRAAASLSRRAKNALGFVGTHCPAETSLRDAAAGMVDLAQGILRTPECRD